MFPGQSSVDRIEIPDQEEATIYQERMVDLKAQARGKGVTATYYRRSSRCCRSYSR